MSWNYRIILHDLDPDPAKHWYALHEVYYGLPNDPQQPGIGPTATPTSFSCAQDEGAETIIQMLERALATLRDPHWSVVLTDSGMAQGIGREVAQPRADETLEPERDPAACADKKRPCAAT